MIKHKVKFKILTYRGNSKTITRKIDFPDFKPMFSDLVITGDPEVDKRPISIETQMIDWLDEWDKREFMNDNDISTIIDYWLVSDKKNKASVPAKESKLTFEDVIGMVEMEEGMLIDIMAVYTEMYETIHDLSALKQLSIVLNAVSVGLKSKIEAFDSLNRTSVPSVKEYYDQCLDKGKTDYRSWAKKELSERIRENKLIDKNT